MKVKGLPTVLISLCLILIVGLFLSVAGCAAPAPTPAKPIELKLAFAWAPQSFCGVGVLEPWARSVEEATDGRVKITVYGAETLGKQKDQYDMVVAGVTDLACIETEITPGRFPLSEIDWLPELYPSAEITGRVVHELLEKYCVKTELSEVKLLFLVALPPAQLQTVKPVHTLEDLKGMKMVAEGKVDSWTVEALGATPVAISMAEVYTSLERGLVEGTTLIWEGVLAFRAHEVTKYRTGCNLFCRAFPVIMNLDVWNSLPSDIQKAFEECSGVEASAAYGAAFDEADKGAMGAIMDYDKNVGNPGIYFLPEAERDRWMESLSTVWDKWVEEKEAMGLPGKAMLEDAQRLVEQYSK